MRKRIGIAVLAALVAFVALLPVASSVSAAPNKYMYSQEYQTTAFVPSILAATATEEDPIFIAQRDVTITSVQILPQAAVTGDTTNSKTLDVVDKSTDGTGTTAISTSLVLATGTNLTAFKPQTITLAAAATGGFKLASGRALTLKTTKVGTGVLMPGLQVVITYEPR